ncbi:MAG: fibronectin type III domain-containing protein [Actinobacteria bacterium]|nr:fibronectin type III domain-containing protein [Actinomycetota bacterium]MCI0543304.1 fibronectin type III domain-containing protein [Actinomycetota bacterium]
MRRKLFLVLVVVAFVVGSVPLTASAAVPTWPDGAFLFTFSLTETATELKWPEATDTDGDLAYYSVRVDGLEVQQVDPNSGDEPGVAEWVVQGLTTGTEYDFAVIAIDGAAGESAALAADNVIQLDPPNWPADAQVSASSVTHNSATISWPEATDPPDGSIISYEVNGYRDPGDGGPYEQFFQEQVAGNVLSYNLTGLDPETLYYFLVGATDNTFAQAFASDPIGDPDNLVDVEFTTLETPPPPPPPEFVESTVGAVDPNTGVWRLRNTEGDITTFFYGNPGDYPFMGDWDCDGDDTPGLYRQSDGFVYLRNTNTQGNANIRFFFGNPGDIPLAGDFDGDGCDTVSIYRPSEGRIYVINELGENDGGLGAADFSFLFGNLGDKPFTGDFNGDGVTTVGLHRESTGFVYFRNSNTQGIAHFQFFFGNPGDRLVAGDWGTVDGDDTPGLFRPGNSTWYFRHSNTQGNADSQFQWGESHWLPVSGEFGLG